MIMRQAAEMRKWISLPLVNSPPIQMAAELLLPEYGPGDNAEREKEAVETPTGNITKGLWEEGAQEGIGKKDN